MWEKFDGFEAKSGRSAAKTRGETAEQENTTKPWRKPQQSLATFTEELAHLYAHRSP
jgi:hypothetical protein